jgi:hypothetical protein
VNQTKSNQIKPAVVGGVRKYNSPEKAQRAQKLLRLWNFCVLSWLFRWLCKNQGESNRIKPACWSVRPSLHPQLRAKVFVVRLLRLIAATPLALRGSSRIKVNQTKSNQIKPAVMEVCGDATA